MYNLISVLLLTLFIQAVTAQTNKEKDIELIKAARKASNEAIARPGRYRQTND